MTFHEHVRARTGMYFGPRPTTYDLALIVASDAACDLADENTFLVVSVSQSGTICVADNGPGIPNRDIRGAPRISRLLETLPIGGHPGRGVIAHVGAVCTNLSVQTVSVDGIQRARVVEGVLAGVEQSGRTTEPTGTTVEFTPDYNFVESTPIDVDKLRSAIIEEAAKDWNVDLQTRITVGFMK